MDRASAALEWLHAAVLTRPSHYAAGGMTSMRTAPGSYSFQSQLARPRHFLKLRAHSWSTVPADYFFRLRFERWARDMTDRSAHSTHPAPGISAISDRFAGCAVRGS